MKQRIANLLKYNKALYTIYYYTMNVVVNMLKLFIKTDNKLILFNSFAGRKFNDSPKAIYDVMIKDKRFTDYRLVWAFHNPEEYSVANGEKIKTDGIKYFITTIKARAWITNSSVERGLRFSGKNTLYFNTWHGTPLKKMGSDVNSKNESFGVKGGCPFDIMMSQGNYETDIFSRSFGIPKSKFLEVGLPRNDILYKYTNEQRNQIRKKLGISDKKVILYCPTYREYEKDKGLGVVMAPPMDLGKWEEQLGSRFVLLIRAHYEVSKVMNIEEDMFVKNVTEYPDLNELFIASDVLLSDYSSVYFDYSIMGKPMLHFTYDYDQYEANRGMYFDIRNYLNGAETEEKVIEYIKNLNDQKEEERTKAFRDEFVNYYGSAAQAAVDCIADRIM